MQTRVISTLVVAGLTLFTTATAQPTTSTTSSASFFLELAEAHAASAAGFGEFLATCPYSHRAADDPIVYPGQFGASHMHDFLGNVTTNASTTLQSLLVGGTTCNPVTDRSSYWVPTLYDAKNNPVPFEHVTFYYFVDTEPASALHPYPLGLRIIAGDAMANTPPSGPSRFKWGCLGAGNSSTTDFVVCPAGSKLEVLLDFPDCWNGTDLDSPNHKSHMAYSQAGKCPTTHPVPVPQLQYKLRYAAQGEVGMRLSTMSGAAITMHGDFFNAWDVQALDNRMNCLHQLIKCTEEGFPGTVDPTPLPTAPPSATATSTPPSPASLTPRSHLPVVRR